MALIDKYNPAVSKNVLLLMAGVVWDAVGLILLFLAFSWLSAASSIHVSIYIAGGVALALLVHHFGFLKIVNRNINRILQMDQKKCFFSFIPYRSYLLIIIMMAAGIILRRSIIPKYDLSILYIGIGLAMILSSVRYLRVFFIEIRK